MLAWRRGVRVFAVRPVLVPFRQHTRRAPCGSDAAEVIGDVEVPAEAGVRRDQEVAEEDVVARNRQSVPSGVRSRIGHLGDDSVLLVSKSINRAAGDGMVDGAPGHASGDGRRLRHPDEDLPGSHGVAGTEVAAAAAGGDVVARELLDERSERHPRRVAGARDVREDARAGRGRRSVGAVALDDQDRHLGASQRVVGAEAASVAAGGGAVDHERLDPVAVGVGRAVHVRERVRHARVGRGRPAALARHLVGLTDQASHLAAKKRGVTGELDQALARAVVQEDGVGRSALVSVEAIERVVGHRVGVVRRHVAARVVARPALVEPPILR